MRKSILIFILLQFVCVSCGNYNSQSYSRLHSGQILIINGVQVPVLNYGLSFEGHDIEVLWTECDNAIGYELQYHRNNEWVTVYSGLETKYTPDTTDRSLAYRIRAIYSNGAIQWDK